MMSSEYKFRNYGESLMKKFNSILFYIEVLLVVIFIMPNLDALSIKPNVEQNSQVKPLPKGVSIYQLDN